MDTSNDWQYLLSCYYSKSISREELERLISKVEQRQDPDGLDEALLAYWHQAGEVQVPSGRHWDTAWQSLLQSVTEPAAIPPLRKRRPLWRYAAAAVLVLLATGIVLWLQRSPVSTTTTLAKTDIAPGTEGAILTLADGTKVLLDSTRNGVVATQPGASVLIHNGQLLYDTAGVTTGSVAYNTMTTPKGRQFHLTLPDGTIVWLNAASSLRYPTAFTGSERRVEITGEAYFEIAQNSRVPFKVGADNRADVEVLGTNFNINAYADEPTLNTALFTGAIRVSARAAAGSSAILKPGQVAQVPAAGAPIRITTLPPADMEQIIAWKNGLFNFDNASLEETMKQLSRWYDMEVVYEKGIPDIRFFGAMSRGLMLSEVLRILEETGVHFKVVAGKKLIVTP